MELIFGMTLGITFLLILLLSGKLKDNLANLFLLLLLLSVSIGTLYSALLNYHHLQFFIVLPIVNALPVLTGTLIYLYIRFSLYPLNRNAKKTLAHFIPFFVATAINFLIKNESALVFIFVEIILKICVSIIYLILSLYIIRRQDISTKNHFSNTDNFDLKWLKFIVYIGLITYIIYLLLITLGLLKIEVVRNTEFYANLVPFLFVLPMSYYGLTSTNVFLKISAINTDEEVFFPSHKQKSDIKELISSEKADEIYKKLIYLVETEKLFLNENLMIEDIAGNLNLHSKYLSYVINTKSGKTFFDFINQYRVKEFNAEILNPRNKNLTIMTIAYQCGFGSKSSFNRVYKNELGISPRQFIKNANNQ